MGIVVKIHVPIHCYKWQLLLQQTIPLIDIEGQLLVQKVIYTVSKIMEIDYLTGRLIIDENRAERNLHSLQNHGNRLPHWQVDHR